MGVAAMIHAMRST